jgi:hypothetical protein
MLQGALDVKTVPAPKPPEFSLVCGGPLFRMCRHAHLSGDALELLHRRVLAISLLAWLPLLVLSVIDGRAVAGAVKIPFLYDVETHVRFLLALPLFIIADVIVDEQIRPMPRRFVERRIVRPGDMPAFNAAVTWALRVRDSAAVEATLLLVVYTLGLSVWWGAIAPDAATWYVRPEGTGLSFSGAGYWYAFVSIPLFQFILCRWYLRLALWFWLLWRISRLDLQLTAAHPDGAGGLGFLGISAYAFSPVLFAQGVLLAGLIATRIFYQGRTLPAFELEIVSWIGATVLLILGPLGMFTPLLERTKRKDRAAFGTLASEYVCQFDAKWLRRGPRGMRALLGSSDIQSLADLGNSYGVVSGMRLVPFGKADVTGLIVAAATPLLPLALTMFSVEELLRRLFRLFFR